MFSVGTVGGEWVGLWGTASGLELAEPSPSSAGTEPRARPRTEAWESWGQGSPAAMQLDTNRALGKYPMNGDSASKSYSKTRSLTPPTVSQGLLCPLQTHLLTLPC